MSLYPGDASVVLPGHGNLLNTAQLDLFVSRLLRSTSPPCFQDHCVMYQWWNNEARPALWRMKQRKAAEREALVLGARRAEQEGEAVLPASPPH